MCHSVEDASAGHCGEHHEGSPDDGAGAVGQQERASTAASPHRRPAEALHHPQGDHRAVTAAIHTDVVWWHVVDIFSTVGSFKKNRDRR